MKRSNELYWFISQINQKIVRVEDQATLFTNACSMAIEFGKFDWAWIGLFDHDEPRKIAMVEHSGISEEVVALFDESTLGFSFPQHHVLQTGKHYICNDIGQDPELVTWRQYASTHGIRSCMVLPIRKSGMITGTFNLYSSHMDFSSDDETTLLVEVASDISFALDLFEKDRLLEERELERQKAADELALSNDALKKTNTELDRFVYSASHDLRAPLTSVLGLISLIEMGTHDAETTAYASMIRSSIKRLEGFITNILRYSKNNRLELEITHVPVGQTIEEIVEFLRHSKESEGITFQIHLEETHPFYSDIHRMTIILENLISNAIKFQDYSREKRIIAITGDSNSERLLLNVTDNGIGIPAVYQSKIYDMFFRISSERLGSGIGLYIVREAVAKLQGMINVYSVERSGTTFEVTLKNFGSENKG